MPTSTNVLLFHSYAHIHECATVSLIYPHPRMCYCFHRLLDWRERKAATNEHKTKYDKIVIVSHAFHPSEFEEEALLINEIKDDLREECGKFGVVKKILLFDRHPGGVVSVGFKEAESAAACVTAMNGRWYGGRQLGVAIWDGVTNYQVEETEKEREERLKEWENFLEEGEGEGGKGGGKGGGKDSTATSTHQSRGEDKESGES
ncbi:HIV Tat-specific factor 1 homolog [Geodia barretti]|uniref:HIV Tat-specific factor 1 homolog n=1 Tax=Geodia barretti TaxID=519541 RepID=A0AA35TMW1_GEOBA|nr:HIV Tat-specific factor 1 homolog [Geodia barretti]